MTTRRAIAGLTAKLVAFVFAATGVFADIGVTKSGPTHQDAHAHDLMSLTVATQDRTSAPDPDDPELALHYPQAAVLVPVAARQVLRKIAIPTHHIPAPPARGPPAAAL